jgi:protein-tyrosine phosphatase
MKEEVIDVSGYRSKRLTDELVKKAGLILVMEERHRDDIITRAPEAAAKTQLLKKFGLECALTKPGGFAVPDPIGRPIKDYEYCLSVIKREIERIAELL